MRLCPTAQVYTGTEFDNGGMPAGADASIGTYVAGIRTYFENVSIAFTDTTFTIGSTAYTAKATTLTDISSYNVWLPDSDSSVLGDPYDWYEVAISNTRLTFGGIWKTTHTSDIDLPKRCAPAWWWQLDADIGGKQCIVLSYRASGTVDGGLFNAGGVSAGSNNADGICVPNGFQTTNSTPQCQFANIGPETSSFNLPGQMEDTGGRKYPTLFMAPTTCIITHNTTPTSLPACPA